MVPDIADLSGVTVGLDLALPSSSLKSSRYDLSGASVSWVADQSSECKDFKGIQAETESLLGTFWKVLGIESVASCGSSNSLRRTMSKETGTSTLSSHEGQHVKTEKKETYSYILREFPTA